MTIEEAVLVLKRYQGYEPMEDGNILKHSFDLTDETVDTLLSAIRTELAGEPLTLEQLREMDGEPVWVKCLKPSQYTDPPVRWRILEKSMAGNFGVWNRDSALIERTYGVDWLAYRRPPEGEED